MFTVLLDADVIIDLHRFGVWNQVVEKQNIFISSIILRQEVYFYGDHLGIRHDINLLKDIGKKFSEISVTTEELMTFIEQFDKVLKEELHAGEKEALKILQNREDIHFCTCDKAAITSIALIGKRDQGMSCERLLKSSGINRRIEYKHTERFFRKYLDEGSIMRIHRFKIDK